MIWGVNLEDTRKYIELIKNLLISSPLRKKLADSDNIPFKNLISQNLNKVMDSIEILEHKENEPLKIVILGEVKSGKSSLVNALLNKEISEVDVLEATSTIIEVFYSDEEYFRVSNDITKIGLDLEYLKKINIVDTPGLRSTTLKNEQTTLKYIENADLIMFVVDATHLGQEDIYDSLDYIASFNKPLIGIVNKCDLINDDKDEIREYINDEYGIYCEDLFMISSFLEYQDRISKNAKAEDRDIMIPTDKNLKEGFENLKRYINNVYDNYECVKVNSVKSSIESIVHKEVINNYDYSKSISIIIDELKKYRKLLENKVDYISTKMNFEIEDWVNRIFLSDELEKIKNSIEDAEIYINEAYINSVISKKKEELDQIFFEEWIECLKEVSNEVDEDIKKYIENIEYRSELSEAPRFEINDEKINLNELLATVGTGAILGATSGGVISLYAAGVGTSSASITIGSALITYCPPLLIAGTISGALGKLIYDKIKNDQRNKELIKDIEIFIKEIKSNVVGTLTEGYDNSSKEIVRTTEDIFKISKNISINNYEAEKLIEDIEAYVDDLKKYMNYCYV